MYVINIKYIFNLGVCSVLFALDYIRYIYNKTCLFVFKDDYLEMVLQFGYVTLFGKKKTQNLVSSYVCEDIASVSSF